MIQLDLIGSLALTGIWLVAKTLEFPLEAACLWVLVSAVAWVHLKARVQQELRLQDLQERINACHTKEKTP